MSTAISRRDMIKAAAVTLGGVLLSSCGQTPAPTSMPPSATKAATPASSVTAPTAIPTKAVRKVTRVEILAPSPYAAPTPRAENSYLQELERRVGVQMEFSFVPNSDWDPKLQTTLASGSLPDLLAAFGWDRTLVQAVKANAFLKISQLGLPENTRGLPGLSLFPKTSWDNSALNGEYYALPTAHSRYNSGEYALLRKDWLAKFGMEVPKTIDDFKKYADSCVNKDPDGNGRSDTIAFSFGEKRKGWAPFMQSFGVGTTWEKGADGKLQHADVSSQMKAFVTFMADLYKMKAINPEFLALKADDTYKEVVSNRSGGFADNDQAGPCRQGKQVRDANPGADVVFLWPPLRVPGAEAQIPASKGWLRLNLIHAKYAKDLDAAWELVRLMDFWFDPANERFVQFGIEGVHHTIDADGNPVLTTKGQNDIQWIRAWGPKAATLMIDSFVNYVTADWKPRILKLRQESEKLLKEDPTFGLWVDFGGTDPTAELTAFATQTLEQMITGKKSLNDWDAYVKDWYAKGGQRLTDEWTKTYQQFKKG